MRREWTNQRGTRFLRTLLHRFLEHELSYPAFRKRFWLFWVYCCDEWWFPSFCYVVMLHIWDFEEIADAEEAEKMWYLVSGVRTTLPSDYVVVTETGTDAETVHLSAVEAQ